MKKKAKKISDKIVDEINDSFSVERKKAMALALRDLREKRDLTQKELADALFVTDSTISHYEQNISIPTTEMLVKLAKFFDVSTDYLVNNCTDSVNFPKHLNKKLAKEMTVGRAVSVMINATPEQKNIIVGILKMIEDQQEAKQ